ncbi:hypothetical protein EVAR_70129_1 [Eumeta japonica]|uniref:Uncharacterized protein n=1 Tax=Eumeta variegata TaxID=151549 RepID=A0A4C1Z3A1_EUMVA|nr:hypothetical protein EVAR_70129_1 [Eumeta japonica]
MICAERRLGSCDRFRAPPRERMRDLFPHSVEKRNVRNWISEVGKISPLCTGLCQAFYFCSRHFPVLKSEFVSSKPWTTDERMAKKTAWEETSYFDIQTLKGAEHAVDA